MANIVNHLQKGLRHHVPLIKFRYGFNQAGANSSTHSQNGSKTDSDLASSLHPSPSAENPSKAIKKSVSLEFSQTPNKYRRRPLTQDEIDLVTIGGST